MTSFTDFGLRAMMRLAAEPDRALSTAEIADAYGISRNHLTKSMAALARAGLIITRRGGGGGAILARPASEITVGEIVRALSSYHPLVECFREDGGQCILNGRCRLKSRLAQAREAFLAALDKATLAEIMVEPEIFDLDPIPASALGSFERTGRVN